MKRETGYYWVYWGEYPNWYPVLFTGELWLMDTCVFKDVDFKKINEARIKEPDEK